ncbi:hypothetical protein DFJ77DRAFT_466066 [Powellomyces hirtus]|nr:hypothetical protein DFJ77DRAFT_466066 [Powellomyces hirtus]
MAGIMKMERKQYDQVPSPMRFAHSLHAGKRARDCAQIDKDNLAILARLEARTSFYPHGEHLASRRQNLHYLCNMAAYPTRFQAQEKIYTLLTRTHMNAHDPALGSARREEIVRDWTTPSMTGAVAHETREKMERERKRQLREAAAREEQVKAAKEAKAARASSPKLPVAETDKALLSKPGSAPASPPLLPRIKSRSTHELEREVSPVQVPMAAIQAV